MTSVLCARNAVRILTVLQPTKHMSWSWCGYKIQHTQPKKTLITHKEDDNNNMNVIIVLATMKFDGLHYLDFGCIPVLYHSCDSDL